VTGFDHLDREWLHGKSGIKWSRPGADLIAAWVADMDFPIPAVVADAIREVIAGGDLGYPDLDGGNPLAAPFAERMRTRHGWDPDPGRVWAFTDVLNAVQAVLELMTQPGAGVAVHTPTYPPFLRTLETMRRRLVPIPFHSGPRGWFFDPERAAEAFSDAEVLLLVNPHNPTGRVLTRIELDLLAELAATHDVMVISDEVHAELLYPGHEHIPFATLSEDAARRTITLTSASKTFNLAGIRTAVAHVGSRTTWDALRSRPEHMWGVVGNLSVTATLAAWSGGRRWLGDLLARLARNRSALEVRLGQELDGIRWHSPEGTYLAWLDFRALGLGDNPAVAVRQRSRVELSPGPDFGLGGSGFARLNFATAPNVLDEMLTRLAAGLG
jgi:cystathionine beta-lyase